MTASTSAQMVTAHARDAVYDLVLLAHVLSALIGFGAMVVAGGYALGLLRSGRDSEGVRRYYRPGVNWGGRIIWLVPVLGVTLMLMSHGDWSFSDAWITIGLALWALSALVAEMVLWPTERKLQTWVAGGVVGDADGGGSGHRPEDGSADPSSQSVRTLCLQMVGMATGLFVVLVVATVVMVAKP